MTRRYQYPVSDQDALWRQDMERRLAALERPVRYLDMQRAGNPAQNVSLTTAFTQVSSLTFTPPEWAQKMVAIGHFGGSVTSTGAIQNFNLRVSLSTEPAFEGLLSSISISQTVTATLPFNQSEEAAGIDLPAPFTVNGLVSIGAGANTANTFDLDMTAFFMREY